MSFWVAGRPLPEPVPRGRMPRMTTLAPGIPLRSSPTLSLILRRQRCGRGREGACRRARRPLQAVAVDTARPAHARAR